MAITEQDVLHVARLARLSLTEEELPRLARDMAQFLDYFAELSALDTAAAPSGTYVAVDQAPLRPDEVRPSLDNATALREAARQAEGGFAVPTFMDEG